MNIKVVIDVNKLACDNIASLEEAIRTCEIKNDKDKANFGNLCVALRGFRMVADATEALLINENVLKGEDGNFYKKVEDSVTPPPTTGAPGSDFDIDKENKEKKEK